VIEFTCACGKEYKVKDEMAGRRGKCKECGAEIRVPEKAGSEDYFEALVRERFKEDENYFVGDIPERALAKARSSYAKTMDPSEKPLALSRQTSFTRVFRKGWLFTNKGVYYQNVWARGAFQYADLRECEEKVDTVHTRTDAGTTSHRFLSAVVTLNNGKRHKFDGSMLPFFEALSQKSSGGTTPGESPVKLEKRYTEKLLTGQTSIIKILVIACVAGGVAGLIAGALVAADVFKDEKAPFGAAAIISAIAALIGFVGRNKYACGECGRSVALSQHFCPQCKCVFR
jgi:hypothetical protein